MPIDLQRLEAVVSIPFGGAPVQTAVSDDDAAAPPSPATHREHDHGTDTHGWWPDG